MFYESGSGFSFHFAKKIRIMLVYIHSAKCVGIEALKVTVEVDVTAGIGLHLVGLADAAVKESLLRTVTALTSRGFHIPGKKIVINLAPADMHKSGSGYDLPIALGILAASEQCKAAALGKYLITGELSLDGNIRYVPGALPIVELAAREGFDGCILPEESALEAAEFTAAAVYGVKDLSDVLRIIAGDEPCDDLLVRNLPICRQQPVQAPSCPDFGDIIGQESAKRAAEIAAAGGHNLILVGAPGSGKSTLARAMAGLLPPMSLEEALTTSKVYSVAGLHTSGVGLIRQRPFRAPHHSSSMAAFLGGGSGENILPGEVSLSTGGILFLDEYAETPKSILEALRGPLEDRRVTISRLRAKVEYPSSFMLVAASNPCPCGYYGEKDRCTCTPARREAYLAKLSGPIMDRIDLHVFMHPVDARKLVTGAVTERSEAVARRVAAARRIQEERLAGEGIFTNAEMDSRSIKRHCHLSEECLSLLERLMLSMGLSARAYTRIIRIARTIADLEAAAAFLASSGSAVPDPIPGPIRPEHIAEAASFRFLDRQHPFQ